MNRDRLRYELNIAELDLKQAADNFRKVNENLAAAEAWFNDARDRVEKAEAALSRTDGG